MIPFYLNKALVYFSFSILGLLFIPIKTNAQLTIEWDRTYGGTGYEEMGAAIPTNDGGYMYGGITTSRNPEFEVSTSTQDSVDYPVLTGDFWIIKTDGNGNPVWDKRFGGYHEDRLWSIVQTNDGGYLLGGESRSGIGGDHSQDNRGDLDFWVVKIDANGNKQWDRRYGGTGADLLRKIILLPNGQYWLAGFSNSPKSFEKSMDAFNGTGDFWCVKIDENGTQLGDYAFGGDGLDRLFDATLAADGNLILVGPTESNPSFNKTAPFYGLNDMWVVKCSQNGILIWDAAFGGNKEDVPQRICKTKTGSYILIGQSTSDKMSGNKTAAHFGGDDVWVVKFSDGVTSPVMVWNEAFGGTSSDQGYCVVETSLGNLQVIGESSSLPDASNKTAPVIGGKDYWFLMLDNNGNKLWDETLGGISDDGAKYIMPAHDYGIILAGISNSDVFPPYKSEDARGNHTNDLYVVRTGCSFPPPNLADMPKHCLDEKITIDATVPAPCIGCVYIWDDGVTGPYRSFSPDTSLEMKVTIQHPDGCELSDSVTIEIVPGPDNLTLEGDPISCYGKSDATLFLDGIDGVAPPFEFAFNGKAWGSTLNEYQLSAGVYPILVRDTNGCMLDTSIYIAPKEQVIVELGLDIYLDYGDSVQLQALTNLTDSFTFNWGQPTLISCSDCLEPWVKPTTTTTYSIEIKDKDGCMAADLVRVILQKSEGVYIPNTFSPNLDNINDFFTIYSDKTVSTIKSLLIFDRWGEKMFERHDFQPNKESLGWNGRLNDRQLDPGVFAYWAEVVYFDGRTEIFMGDLTLMN